MPSINLDFTNVETSKRIPAGTHTVTISAAEIKQASSGNQMLAVTFKNSQGEVAYDRFVLLPQSMWRLKIFLEAVFNTPFTGKTTLDPRNLVGRSLVITCIDEEYINDEGNPALRSAVQNDFAPVSVAQMVGVAPEVPQAPQNIPAPQPQPIIQPQVDNVAGAPVQPLPTQPVQPNINPGVQPIPQPQPQPANVAPTPTPSAGRPKLPWE